MMNEKRSGYLGAVLIADGGGRCRGRAAKHCANDFGANCAPARHASSGALRGINPTPMTSWKYENQRSDSVCGVGVSDSTDGASGVPCVSGETGGGTGERGVGERDVSASADGGADEADGGADEASVAEGLAGAPASSIRGDLKLRWRTVSLPSSSASRDLLRLGPGEVADLPSSGAACALVFRVVLAPPAAPFRPVVLVTAFLPSCLFTRLPGAAWTLFLSMGFLVAGFALLVSERVWTGPDCAWRAMDRVLAGMMIHVWAGTKKRKSGESDGERSHRTGEERLEKESEEDVCG